MKTIKGDYGSIKVDNNGDVVEINRERTSQGFVYKNEEAFLNKEGICYIAELSDEPYTYKDILEISEGNEDLATLVFDDIDWQHPESRYEEVLQEY